MMRVTIPVISLQAKWAKASGFVLPPALAPWLLEPHSLTARLKAHCQQFRLQVLAEHVCNLPEFLAPLLPDCQQALLREVLLWCDGQPCVYAQSWLPLSSLQRLAPLAELGEQPLGEYLFQQPDIQRGEIEVATVAFGLPSLLPIQQCWARRSVFQLAGQSLFVSEVFLPAVAKL